MVVKTAASAVRVPPVRSNEPEMSTDELNTVSKSVRRELYTLFGFVVWIKTLGAPGPTLPPLLADSLRK